MKKLWTSYLYKYINVWCIIPCKKCRKNNENGEKISNYTGNVPDESTVVIELQQTHPVDNIVSEEIDEKNIYKLDKSTSTEDYVDIPNIVNTQIDNNDNIKDNENNEDSQKDINSENDNINSENENSNIEDSENYNLDSQNYNLDSLNDNKESDSLNNTTNSTNSTNSIESICEESETSDDGFLLTPKIISSKKN